MPKRIRPFSDRHASPKTPLCSLHFLPMGTISRKCTFAGLDLNVILSEDIFQYYILGGQGFTIYAPKIPPFSVRSCPCDNTDALPEVHCVL